MNRFFVLLAGLLALFPVLESKADLVTNLTPLADTSLLEVYPDNNLGGLTAIPCGTTPQGRSRALFKFDLTQIPANVTINSAALTVVAVAQNTLHQASVFALNRLLRDWGEGTGQVSNAGDPAKPGEATWNNRFHPSSSWAAPGTLTNVDYVSAFSATNFVDALGSYTFTSTASLVADVQKWVDNPGTNFGWLLISQSEDVVYTVRRFATREDSVQSPVLTVHYTLPPARPSISQPVISGSQILFSFPAEAGQSYVVEFRTSAAGGDWGVISNVPAQMTSTPIQVRDSLTHSTRCYRVRAPY